MGLFRKDQKCDICGLNFRTRKELGLHLQQMHAALSGRPRSHEAAAAPPGASSAPSPAPPASARPPPAGTEAPARPAPDEDVGSLRPQAAAPSTVTELREAGGIKCGLCGRVFGSTPLFAEHMARVHTDKVVPTQG